MGTRGIHMARLKFLLLYIKRTRLCHGVGKLDKEGAALFFMLQRLRKKGLPKGAMIKNWTLNSAPLKTPCFSYIF